VLVTGNMLLLIGFLLAFLALSSIVLRRGHVAH